MKLRFLVMMLMLTSVVPLAADTPPSAAPADKVDEKFHEKFAGEVEKAYGAESWESKRVLSADIVVSFGGNTAIDGKMIMKTDTSGVRIEQKDGTVLVWDGEKAWKPENSSVKRVRFNLLTWPYFLAVPFKLEDPGTSIVPAGKMTAREKEYNVGKLTFAAGTGDAPDDWYLIYQDPQTGHVDHMAYIVTYGKTKEQAAQSEAHSISYSDFEKVDGVLIPMTWKFTKWTKESGPTEQVGEAKLSNVAFIDAAPETFAKPEGAVEDKMPGK